MEDAPQKKEQTGLPAWVMTFADLMSLLMCFFVLLLSFSEMDVNKYKQIAGSMSDAFGVQRKIKVREPPRGINVVAREFSPALPQPTVLNVVQQKTSDTLKSFLATEGSSSSRKGASTIMKRDAQKASKKSDQKKTKSDKKAEKKKADSKGKGKQDKWARMMALNADRIRKALAKEIKDGAVEVEGTDLKILIRIRDQIAFTPGSATLKEGFEDILLRVGKVLRTTKGKITVAGHTDNRPIHNYYFLSNWDLSAMRAVVVMRELHELAEIREQRFKVEGNADTMPIVPNNTPANRSRNRRVEIMLTRGDDIFEDSNVEQLEKKAGLDKKAEPPGQDASVKKTIIDNTSGIPEGDLDPTVTRGVFMEPFVMIRPTDAKNRQ